MRKDGLCCRCGNPVTGKTSYCRECKSKYQKEWNRKRKLNPILHKKDLKYRREYTRNLRYKAFSILSNGKPKCVICGCDVLEVLELNHKTPILRKKGFKGKAFNTLCVDIIKGRVDRNLFDIRCRVCNIEHFLRSTKGLRWKIGFLG